MGMDDTQIKEIVDVIGFRVGELSMRYFGLPLITKRLAHGDYLPHIDNFNAR